MTKKFLCALFFFLVLSLVYAEDSTVESIILKLSHSDDKSLQFQALTYIEEALKNGNKSDTLLVSLENLGTKPTPQVRWTVARYLGRLENPRVKETLQRLLVKEQNAQVRKELQQSLAKGD
ncbi:MAG: HEAT repeat domain-containing protein [Spirochaetaceae bacterium]|jgi:HEAT repeat protein|nr:HEAT repeat domain-containing protein [Spirochaetaceae bacterium]